MGQQSLNAEEIAQIVQEIRDRVRARYPEGNARGLGVSLPDLLPILHARDAAEAKVASIGSVNPRSGGVVNNLIQWSKKQIARGLGWFVRDQVEFNRAVLLALQNTLEALNEVNQTFVAVGGRLDEIRAESEQLSELKDMRVHWLAWRQEWERKLLTNEVHFLRSVSDLHAAGQHRLLELEAKDRERDQRYRESLEHQHARFQDSLRLASEDIQEKLWTDLKKVRLEYEQLIHQELRVLRQKAPSLQSKPALPEPLTPLAPAFDYMRFAERFRGSEDYVARNVKAYLPLLEGRTSVLEIGCGRGEFLELLQSGGITARGIDLDPESVALCQAKGLQSETADLFRYLPQHPVEFDAIFASQVIEHLSPESLPLMIQLCAASLRQGGILILETPNPECLAIFATHFYLDPTHTRPIPPPLATFYLEEMGFGNVEIRRLAPAAESMPSLAQLPEQFRQDFFGFLDYAVIGTKL